jgi:hypothetical protein
MSGWTVWLILSLDAFFWFNIIAAILLWLLLVGSIGAWEKYSDDENFQIKFTVGVFFLAIFFSLAAVFVPSTKQAATIYVLPKIVNSEQVETLTQEGAETLKKIKTISDEWLDELRPEKKVEK